MKKFEAIAKTSFELDGYIISEGEKIICYFEKELPFITVTVFYIDLEYHQFEMPHKEFLNAFKVDITVERMLKLFKLNS
jgi:hypothetical protein